MAFHAAKPTPCIKCPVIIAQGEPITWTRGKGVQPGVYHVVCPQDIPAAVTFAPGYTPEAAAYETAIEQPIDDDPLPPEPDEGPLPGTRAWFRTATIADRECQLVQAVGECYTRRAFVKAVVRYSRGLDDRATARLRRYARGLWDGRIASSVPDDDDDGIDSRQLTLFPAPSLVTTHSVNTQTWRALVPMLETAFCGTV